MHESWIFARKATHAHSVNCELVGCGVSDGGNEKGAARVMAISDSRVIAATHCE